MHDPLIHLAHTLAHQLLECGPHGPEFDEELRRLTHALRTAVVRDTERDSAQNHGSRYDYGALLRPALAAVNRQLAPTAAALASLPLALPWTYHYPSRPGEADLAERIAFAELIGPDGPMDASACRVGFTLIAPDTVYPLHRHPAVELYWVISGTALWITQRLRQTVPPGEFVLHRCNEAHSMTTFDEPLLALWGWSGDIDTPASYT